MAVCLVGMLLARHLQEMFKAMNLVAMLLAVNWELRPAMRGEILVEMLWAMDSAEMLLAMHLELIMAVLAAKGEEMPIAM